MFLCVTLKEVLSPHKLLTNIEKYRKFSKYNVTIK